VNISIYNVRLFGLHTNGMLRRCLPDCQTAEVPTAARMFNITIFANVLVLRVDVVSDSTNLSTFRDLVHLSSNHWFYVLACLWQNTYTHPCRWCLLVFPDIRNRKVFKIRWLANITPEHLLVPSLAVTQVRGLFSIDSTHPLLTQRRQSLDNIWANAQRSFRRSFLLNFC